MTAENVAELAAARIPVEVAAEIPVEIAARIPEIDQQHVSMVSFDMVFPDVH